MEDKEMQSKCDMQDLMRAHEIMSDKKRFKAALGAAKMEKAKITSLEGLKSKYKEVVDSAQEEASEDDSEDDDE